MGWAIFFVWIIFGVILNILGNATENAPEDSPKKKSAEKKLTICLWIAIFGLSIGILYVLGWLWYYLCGGFLILEDQPFLDKIICGLVSLILFGFIIGFIMICFGWDPDKR